MVAGTEKDAHPLALLDRGPGDLGVLKRLPEQSLDRPVPADALLKKRPHQRAVFAHLLIELRHLKHRRHLVTDQEHARLGAARHHGDTETHHFFGGQLAPVVPLGGDKTCEQVIIGQPALDHVVPLGNLSRVVLVQLDVRGRFLFRGHG